MNALKASFVDNESLSYRRFATQEDGFFHTVLGLASQAISCRRFATRNLIRRRFRSVRSQYVLSLRLAYASGWFSGPLTYSPLTSATKSFFPKRFVTTPRSL